MKGGDLTDVEPMDNIGPKVMEMLKEDILSGPTLARLDPYRIFYIKTDWSKVVMGQVLLQAHE